MCLAMLLAQMGALNWYYVVQLEKNVTGLLGMRQFSRFPSFNGLSFSKHSVWEFFSDGCGKQIQRLKVDKQIMNPF